MHRDGVQAELSTGANHAKRDLPSIGNEDFLEHGSGGFDSKEPVAEFYRLAVLDEDLDDGARNFGLDFVHELHGLDDAKHLARRDRVALLDERLSLGGGRAVESADERRRHIVAVVLVSERAA